MSTLLCGRHDPAWPRYASRAATNSDLLSVVWPTGRFGGNVISTDAGFDSDGEWVASGAYKPCNQLTGRIVGSAVFETWAFMALRFGVRDMRLKLACMSVYCSLRQGIDLDRIRQRYGQTQSWKMNGVY